MRDVGYQDCEIPKDFVSARGILSQELAEKLNVTGEEKYVEEVMKARGMDIKNGAVTIVTSVGNGRVRHQRRQLWVARSASSNGLEKSPLSKTVILKNLRREGMNKRVK